ncbi:MAG: hypothetical protein MUE94_00055 [Verrucomicrobia bacterium]|nr:hypothetical protein [Verrucomicrobiota bacterium]
MKRTATNLLRLRLPLAVFASVATPAMACTACFGQSDSEMAQGMNWGIYTLLGVIGVVLVCIASTFVVVGRRFSRNSIPSNPVSKP